MYSSKIAKPLKGGNSHFANVLKEEEGDVATGLPSLSSRRSSWYISLLKK